MANINIEMEEYLKNLTPELQEKARACKTKDELIQLLAEEGIEIPMDALESVAGGCRTVSGMVCRSCGSEDITLYSLGEGGTIYICRNCESTAVDYR